MDIEKILKAETDESGNVPSAKFGAIVNAIKREVGQDFVERGRYNDRLAEIENLKGEVKAAEEKAASAEQLKVKYDAIKAEYKDFKTETEKKAVHNAKADKFREMLRAAGVPDKYHDRIVEVSSADIDALDVDDNGAVKDADKLTEGIKSHWGDFIPTVEVVGVPSVSPVLNTTKKYTSRDEIMAIADPEERQAQIAANIELFTRRE